MVGGQGFDMSAVGRRMVGGQGCEIRLHDIVRRSAGVFPTIGPPGAAKVCPADTTGIAANIAATVNNRTMRFNAPHPLATG